jgi:hypothetical protein
MNQAYGFLWGYIWLIATPLDLKLTRDLFLLPGCVTWTWWKAFVKDVASNGDVNTSSAVSKRYQLDSLRLDRINHVYPWRFLYSHLTRGYWHPPTRNLSFFERIFS